MGNCLDGMNKEVILFLFFLPRGRIWERGYTMICVCLNCNNVQEWITVVCVGRSFHARLPKKWRTCLLTRLIVNPCKLLALATMLWSEYLHLNLWFAAKLVGFLNSLPWTIWSSSVIVRHAFVFFFLPPSSTVINTKATRLVGDYTHILYKPPPSSLEQNNAKGQRSFQVETFQLRK